MWKYKEILFLGDYLFICLWLWRVFPAAGGLSPAAGREGGLGLPSPGLLLRQLGGSRAHAH